MNWIEILKESLPYIVPIVAIIIVAVMKRFGITGYKPEQVARVINIVLNAIGWVEVNQKGITGIDKLKLAKEIAIRQMDSKDLKILHNIGIKDEKDPKKETFGDALLAGVQNVFVNSASNLLSKQAEKLIKKM